MFQQVSSEEGETSNILSSVNALGNVVPPMIIHKGQPVQDSWKIVTRYHISATTKGYITKLKFHEYGLKFIKYLKDNGLANQKNLIIDSHKSHNKVHFWDLFVSSWNQAMVPKNIIAGFCHTGIYLLTVLPFPKLLWLQILSQIKKNGGEKLVLKFC